MSIEARCGDCQKLYKVADNLAGKKVRCKACGGVVEIPLGSEEVPQTAQRPAAASSARSKLTSRPAVAKPENDDPFNNLDDLMSLEGSGTVTDEPMPLRPGKTKRLRESADDGVVAAPAYAPAPVRSSRWGGGRSDDGPRDAYVAMANGDAIDSFVPTAAIGILILFLIITFFRMMNATNSPGFAYSVMMRLYGIIFGVIFGILTPLCMLGVFSASKVMKFETPGSFFLRCGAVVCMPLSLSIVVAGFGFADPTPLGAGVSFITLLGTLWLMFRLRLVPYLVTAGFTFVSLIVVPYLVIVMILSMIGYTGGLRFFSALGESRNRSVEIKSAVNLKQIGMGLAIYANENKGRYPTTLDVLPGTADIDAAALQSPLGSKKYVYNYFPGLNSGTAGDYIVAYDPNKTSGRRTPVLYHDGSADELDAQQWDKAMQRNAEIQRIIKAGGSTATVRPGNPSQSGVFNSGQNNSTSSQPPPRIPDRTPAVVNKPVDFPAHHAAVEAALRRIAGAINSYTQSHNGSYPLNLYELRNLGLAMGELRSPFGYMYVYTQPRNLKPPLPGKLVLVFEEGVKDKKRTVIWGDLRVETIDIGNWDEVLSESNRLRVGVLR